MNTININQVYEIQYDTTSDIKETIYQVALIHIPSSESVSVLSAEHNKKALRKTIKKLCLETLL